MRPHPAISTTLLLALIAGGSACRPDGSTPDEDERSQDADAEEPIVAPSRVVFEGGEARVVLDTAEIRRIGLRSAALGRTVAESGPRLTGQVVPEPERTATLRAPVAGRLAVPDGRRWPALGERLEAGATIGRTGAETFWGGYSGVFVDPDGHPWEIAHNPGWTLHEDGSISLSS